MGCGWARDCASSLLFRVVDSQKISEKLPTNNHVENKAAQQKFANQPKSTVATINDMVNFFEYGKHISSDCIQKTSWMHHQ